ncbi:MAG TPA: SCO family protein [Gemmataceae bacterium]|nr:SCO family protein [Gemmataceae bacterium]
MIRRTLMPVIALAALAAPAPAQSFGGKAPEPGEQPTRAPNVDFEQRLGEQVPIDIPFRDESGRRTTLRECMNGKPTILVLAYFHCPHMCGEVQAGVLAAARAMPDYHAGRDYTIVIVSFDPKDNHLMAAAQRDFYVKHYGRPDGENGWRFLTGERRPIEELTTAVGFKYEFDKPSKEYSHAAGIMVLTPEGKISKYFYGVTYTDKDQDGAPKDPATANDLKRAMVDAGGGKVGGPVQKFLMMCSRLLHIDTSHPYLMMVVRAAGALTVLVLAGSVIYAIRRERRKAAAAAAAPTEQPAGGV